MLTEMMRLLAEHPDAVGAAARTTRPVSTRSSRRPCACRRRRRGCSASPPRTRARRCRHPGGRTTGDRVLVGQPGRGAVRPTRTSSTRTGPTSRTTWRSARASTSASAPRCPGWRAGWPCRSCLDGSTRFSLADTNEYRYFPSFMLRGLTRLDVDFTRRRPMTEHITGTTSRQPLAGKVAVVTGSQPGHRPRHRHRARRARGHGLRHRPHDGRRRADDRRAPPRSSTRPAARASPCRPTTASMPRSPPCSSGSPPSRATSTCWSTTSTRSPTRRRGAGASGTTRCRSGTTRWASACGRTTWRRGTPRRCCSRPGPAGPSATCRRRAGRATTSARATERARRASTGSVPTWRSSWSRRASPAAVVPGHRGDRVHQGVGRQARHRLEGSQTPLGVGRAIAALVTAPDLMERTGSIQWIEDLGAEFGVVDEHGRPRQVRTPPLTQ